MSVWLIILLAVVAALALVIIYDLTQKRHAILRNFPVIGHLRYILESVGPELRQYIVTDNNEERPFSRDQRRWVYSTAKAENPYFAFGTDNDIDRAGGIVIKHSAFPVLGDSSHETSVPAAKVVGEWRERPQAFRPASIVNISAMSFGSLSGPAIQALNAGAAIAGCLHNTGEGGVSDHHLHGGELIYQVGTGLFGCRSADGTFSIDALLETVAKGPVRAIEIKLSQGAKPGLGGVLPGAKVTAEIAAARGVPVGETVVSPNRHSSFDDVNGLIDFVERIADATGLPVGIKSAVGQLGFWDELAQTMRDQDKGPDFVTIDGGEGGTGAAPLVFTDHVAYPFRTGFSFVYDSFVRANMQQRITFVGAGKLGFPESALASLALGCDMVNVAREAMLAVGCIQAQKCHTGHCPTGVATQSRWLARGLDPTEKSARVANYIIGLRYDLLRLARAGGADHPSLLPSSAVDIITADGVAVPIVEHYGLSSETERLSAIDMVALGGQER